MVDPALAQRVRESADRAREVVLEVCGACGNSCCHQGTMMGSHDLLRFIKGMLLEEGRQETVRRGLAERARELRADIATIRRVMELLGSSPLASEDDLKELGRLVAEWETVADLMEHDFGPREEHVHVLMRFAGIRAVTLRLLAQIPGGHGALANLAQEGSSFRFRGRRLAPPRCVFHSADGGCLAGRWKPGKCANFFCAGEPNVLRELRARLSFDEFVLSSFLPVTAKQVLEAVDLELRLGRKYVEPKILLGLDAQDLTLLEARLGGFFSHVLTPPPAQGRYLQSRAEIEALLEPMGEDEALLVRCQEIDGAALYELALALDAHRQAGEAVAFYLSAEGIADHSPLPHPLWADAEMSQPLGSLDLYLIAGD
jgi:hypothetical protein